MGNFLTVELTFDRLANGEWVLDVHHGENAKIAVMLFRALVPYFLAVERQAAHCSVDSASTSSRFKQIVTQLRESDPLHTASNGESSRASIALLTPFLVPVFSQSRLLVKDLRVLQKFASQEQIYRASSSSTATSTNNNRGNNNNNNNNHESNSSSQNQNQGDATSLLFRLVILNDINMAVSRMTTHLAYCATAPQQRKATSTTLRRVEQSRSLWMELHPAAPLLLFAPGLLPGVDDGAAPALASVYALADGPPTHRTGTATFWNIHAMMCHILLSVSVSTWGKHVGGANAHSSSATASSSAATTSSSAIVGGGSGKSGGSVLLASSSSATASEVKSEINAKHANKSGPSETEKLMRLDKVRTFEELISVALNKGAAVVASAVIDILNGFLRGQPDGRRFERGRDSLSAAINHFCGTKFVRSAAAQSDFVSPVLKHDWNFSTLRSMFLSSSVPLSSSSAGGENKSRNRDGAGEDDDDNDDDHENIKHVSGNNDNIADSEEDPALLFGLTLPAARRVVLHQNTLHQANMSASSIFGVVSNDNNKLNNNNSNNNIFPSHHQDDHMGGAGLSNTFSATATTGFGNLNNNNNNNSSVTASRLDMPVAFSTNLAARSVSELLKTSVARVLSEIKQAFAVRRINAELIKREKSSLSATNNHSDGSSASNESDDDDESIFEGDQTLNSTTRLLTGSKKTKKNKKKNQDDDDEDEKKNTKRDQNPEEQHADADGGEDHDDDDDDFDYDDYDIISEASSVDEQRENAAFHDNALLLAPGSTIALHPRHILQRATAHGKENAVLRLIREVQRISAEDRGLRHQHHSSPMSPNANANIINNTTASFHSPVSVVISASSPVSIGGGGASPTTSILHHHKPTTTSSLQDMQLSSQVRLDDWRHRLSARKAVDRSQWALLCLDSQDSGDPDHNEQQHMVLMQQKQQQNNANNNNGRSNNINNNNTNNNIQRFLTAFVFSHKKKKSSTNHHNNNNNVNSNTTTTTTHSHDKYYSGGLVSTPPSSSLGENAGSTSSSDDLLLIQSALRAAFLVVMDDLGCAMTIARVDDTDAIHVGSSANAYSLVAFGSSSNSQRPSSPTTTSASSNNNKIPPNFESSSNNQIAVADQKLIISTSSSLVDIVQTALDQFTIKRQTALAQRMKQSASLVANTQTQQQRLFYEKQMNHQLRAVWQGGAPPAISNSLDQLLQTQFSTVPSTSSSSNVGGNNNTNNNNNNNNNNSNSNQHQHYLNSIWSEIHIAVEKKNQFNNLGGLNGKNNKKLSSSSSDAVSNLETYKLFVKLPTPQSALFSSNSTNNNGSKSAFNATYEMDDLACWYVQIAPYSVHSGVHELQHTFLNAPSLQQALSIMFAWHSRNDAGFDPEFKILCDEAAANYMPGAEGEEVVDENGYLVAGASFGKKNYVFGDDDGDGDDGDEEDDVDDGDDDKIKIKNSDSRQRRGETLTLDRSSSLFGKENNDNNIDNNMNNDFNLEQMEANRNRRNIIITEIHKKKKFDSSKSNEIVHSMRQGWDVEKNLLAAHIYNEKHALAVERDRRKKDMMSFKRMLKEQPTMPSSSSSPARRQSPSSSPLQALSGTQQNKKQFSSILEDDEFDSSLNFEGFKKKQLELRGENNNGNNNVAMTKRRQQQQQLLQQGGGGGDATAVRRPSSSKGYAQGTAISDRRLTLQPQQLHHHPSKPNSAENPQQPASSRLLKIAKYNNLLGPTTTNDNSQKQQQQQQQKQQQAQDQNAITQRRKRLALIMAASASAFSLSTKNPLLMSGSSLHHLPRVVAACYLQPSGPMWLKLDHILTKWATATDLEHAHIAHLCQQEQHGRASSIVDNESQLRRPWHSGCPLHEIALRERWKPPQFHSSEHEGVIALTTMCSLMFWDPTPPPTNSDDRDNNASDDSDDDDDDDDDGNNDGDDDSNESSSDDNNSRRSNEDNQKKNRSRRVSYDNINNENRDDTTNNINKQQHDRDDNDGHDDHDDREGGGGNAGNDDDDDDEVTSKSRLVAAEAKGDLNRLAIFVFQTLLWPPAGGDRAGIIQNTWADALQYPVVVQRAMFSITSLLDCDFTQRHALRRVWKLGIHLALLRFLADREQPHEVKAAVARLLITMANDRLCAAMLHEFGVEHIIARELFACAWFAFKPPSGNAVPWTAVVSPDVVQYVTNLLLLAASVMSIVEASAERWTEILQNNSDVALYFSTKGAFATVPTPLFSHNNNNNNNNNYNNSSNTNNSPNELLAASLLSFNNTVASNNYNSTLGGQTSSHEKVNSSGGGGYATTKLTPELLAQLLSNILRYVRRSEEEFSFGITEGIKKQQQKLILMTMINNNPGPYLAANTNNSKQSEQQQQQEQQRRHKKRSSPNSNNNNSSKDTSKTNAALGSAVLFFSMMLGMRRSPEGEKPLLARKLFAPLPPTLLLRRRGSTANLMASLNSNVGFGQDSNNNENNAMSKIPRPPSASNNNNNNGDSNNNNDNVHSIYQLSGSSSIIPPNKKEVTMGFTALVESSWDLTKKTGKLRYLLTTKQSNTNMTMSRNGKLAYEKEHQRLKQQQQQEHQPHGGRGGGSGKNFYANRNNKSTNFFSSSSSSCFTSSGMGKVTWDDQVEAATMTLQALGTMSTIGDEFPRLESEETAARLFGTLLEIVGCFSNAREIHQIQLQRQQQQQQQSGNANSSSSSASHHNLHNLHSNNTNNTSSPASAGLTQAQAIQAASSALMLDKEHWTAMCSKCEVDRLGAVRVQFISNAHARLYIGAVIALTRLLNGELLYDTTRSDWVGMACAVAQRILPNVMEILAGMLSNITLPSMKAVADMKRCCFLGSDFPPLTPCPVDASATGGKSSHGSAEGSVNSNGFSGENDDNDENDMSGGGGIDVLSVSPSSTAGKQSSYAHSTAAASLLLVESSHHQQHHQQNNHHPNSRNSKKFPTESDPSLVVTFHLSALLAVALRNCSADSRGSLARSSAELLVALVDLDSAYFQKWFAASAAAAASNFGSISTSLGATASPKPTRIHSQILDSAASSSHQHQQQQQQNENAKNPSSLRNTNSVKATQHGSYSSLSGPQFRGEAIAATSPVGRLVHGIRENVANALELLAVDPEAAAKLRIGAVPVLLAVLRNTAIAPLASSCAAALVAVASHDAVNFVTNNHDALTTMLSALHRGIPSAQLDDNNNSSKYANSASRYSIRVLSNSNGGQGSSGGDDLVNDTTFTMLAAAVAFLAAVLRSRATQAATHSKLAYDSIAMQVDNMLLGHVGRIPQFLGLNGIQRIANTEASCNLIGETAVLAATIIQHCPGLRGVLEQDEVVLKVTRALCEGLLPRLLLQTSSSTAALATFDAFGASSSSSRRKSSTNNLMSSSNNSDSNNNNHRSGSGDTSRVEKARLDMARRVAASKCITALDEASRLNPDCVAKSKDLPKMLDVVALLLSGDGFIPDPQFYFKSKMNQHPNVVGNIQATLTNGPPNQLQHQNNNNNNNQTSANNNNNATSTKPTTLPPDIALRTLSFASRLLAMEGQGCSSQSASGDGREIVDGLLVRSVTPHIVVLLAHENVTVQEMAGEVMRQLRTIHNSEPKQARLVKFNNGL